MLILFLFVILMAGSDAANITATGGGIVKLGEDLVMSYETGGPWDRCFWYWYEHHTDFEYCSYDMASGGVVKQHKCKPDSLSSKMEYTGKTNHECSITIRNVAEDDNCTWAVRLEEDLMPTSIEITVALPVKTVTTSVPERLEANIPGIVQCGIEGGRPAPQMLFQMGSTNSTPEIINNTQTQIPDKDGVFATHQEVWILPKISDHGKSVVCRAAVLDGDSKLIYDWVSASELKLNVTFAPQSIRNQSLTGYANKNITIAVEFQANPAPTDIKWVVVYPDKGSAEDSKRKDITTDGGTSILTLNPGQSDDKYKVALLKSTGEVSYRAELTIMKLAEADEKNEYHLEVKNLIGARDYFFALTIEGNEPNTTTTTGTTTTPGPSTTSVPPEPEGHGVVFAVIALIIITGLVMCSVFIYKKKMQRNNETAPLR